MEGKITYYPVFPPHDDPAEVKTRDVKQWVRQYLIPSNLATDSILASNALLVVGGDGFFMKKATNIALQGKILVGINRGTLGFLLNPIDSIEQIPRYFEQLDIISVRLIKGIFHMKDGSQSECLAFGDIFCGGNIADFIRFKITGTLSYFPNRQVSGNGVVISTPQGTTGFALHNRGSAAVLPPYANTWFISGVATGPYPSDQVNPQEITIEVSSRKAVNGYADGYAHEFKDIVKVVVTPTDHEVKFGVLKQMDFYGRRTLLAQRLERGEY